MYSGDDELAAAVEAFADMIQKTTLALSLTRGEAADGWTAKEWDINGKNATLAVKKNG